VPHASLVAVLLAAAPSQSGGPASAPASLAPPAITLRPVFPDGIEGTRRRTNSGAAGAGGDAHLVEPRERTARLRLARAGEGWALSLDQGFGRTDEDSMRPGLVLVAGADGAFRRFEEVERFRAALHSSLRWKDWLLTRLPIFREGLEEIVQRLIESERVAWEEDVGRWGGRTVVPGRTYQEVRPPARPGALPVVTRFGARGPVACPGEAVPGDCLVLWWREEVDAAALQQACATGEPRAGRAAVIITWLEVVTETATLLPRRASSNTTSRPACPGPGPVDWEKESDQRTYAWRR